MRRPLLVAALLAVGCGARTELVVGLASSLTEDEADHLRLVVRSGQGDSQLVQTFPLAGLKLPGSIGLVPRSIDRAPFTIAVEGLLADDVRITRLAQLNFVDGKTLFMRMALSKSCYGALGTACPDGSWCAGGSCAPIALGAAALPDYTTGAESAAACGGGGELGLTPSSSACAAGASCIDNQCVTMAPLAPLDDLTVAALDAESADELAPDLTLPIDLATAPPIDAAAPDASPDLAMSPPDLAPPDLAPASDLLPPPGPLPDLAFLTVALEPVSAPSPTGAIRAIAVDPSTKNSTGAPVWAVTASGQVLRADAGKSTLAVEDPGDHFELDAIYLHEGDLWVAGQSSAILHRSSSGVWNRIETPPALALPAIVSLAGDGAAGVLALSHLPATWTPILLHVDATSATLAPQPVAGGGGSSNDVDDSIASEPGAHGPCGMMSDITGRLFTLASGGALWQPIDNPVHTGSPDAVHAILGCGEDGSVVTTPNDVYLRASGAWKSLGLAANNVLLEPRALAVEGSEVWTSAINYSNDSHGIFLGETWHYASGSWSKETPFVVNGVDINEALTVAAGADDGGAWTTVVGGSGQLAVQTGGGAWKLLGTSATQSAPLTYFTGRPWSDGKILAWAGGGFGYVQYLPQTDAAGPATVWYTDAIDSSDVSHFHQIPVQLPAGAEGYRAMQIAGVPSQSGGDPTLYLVLSNEYVLRCDHLTTGFTSVELDTGSGGDALGGIWIGDATHIAVAGTSQGFDPAVWRRAGGAGYAMETLPHVKPTLGNTGHVIVTPDNGATFYVGGGQGNGNDVGPYAAWRSAKSGQWALLPHDLAGTVRDAYADSTRVLFASDSGIDQLGSDGALHKISIPSGDEFTGISAASVNDLYFASFYGELLHFDARTGITRTLVGASFDSGSPFLPSSFDLEGGLYAGARSIWMSHGGELVRGVR